VPTWKHRVTLFNIDRNNVIQVLDVAKVADILLLVVPLSGIDQSLTLFDSLYHYKLTIYTEGEYLLSILRAQGIPAVIGAYMVLSYNIVQLSINLYLQFSLTFVEFTIDFVQGDVPKQQKQQLKKSISKSFFSHFTEQPKFLPLNSGNTQDNHFTVIHYLTASIFVDFC
jgi:hypothetical protein